MTRLPTAERSVRGSTGKPSISSVNIIELFISSLLLELDNILPILLLLLLPLLYISLLCLCYPLD